LNNEFYGANIKEICKEIQNSAKIRGLLTEGLAVQAKAKTKTEAAIIE